MILPQQVASTADMSKAVAYRKQEITKLIESIHWFLLKPMPNPDWDDFSTLSHVVEMLEEVVKFTNEASKS